MRKILLITYAFPPVGGIMVQRILSLAKYLPAQGFEVHVLTPRNPATPVFDHELLKQVPAEVVVHRSFTPEPPFYLRKKIWERISPPSKGEQQAAPSNGYVSLKSRISNVVKRQLTPDVQVLWTPFAIRRASAVIRIARAMRFGSDDGVWYPGFDHDGRGGPMLGLVGKRGGRHSENHIDACVGRHAGY